MKKLVFLSAALFVLTMSFASSSVTIKPAVKASELFIPIGNTGQKISLLDLSRMSIKDVQAFTGKKMSFADKLTFKAAQRQLRQSINADGTISSKKLERQFKKSDGTTGFHVGGFALGFLLGVIGVIIAYLIRDEKKPNRVKWAWIGWACWIVLYLAFFL